MARMRNPALQSIKPKVSNKHQFLWHWELRALFVSQQVSETALQNNKTRGWGADCQKYSNAYPYAYMMPNVLRRVLDTFLAFRLPGSSGLTGKVEQLCAQYPELDVAKMGALERLAQVESHSDSMDDLISFSSMTVEESLDAAKIVMEMMTIVDKRHLDGETRLCR